MFSYVTYVGRLHGLFDHFSDITMLIQLYNVLMFGDEKSNRFTYVFICFTLTIAILSPYWITHGALFRVWMHEHIYEPQQLGRSSRCIKLIKIFNMTILG